MLKNFKSKIKKNYEITGLIVLILITAFSTSLFNYKKKYDQQFYSNIIDNVYFKKSLKYIVDNLDPKYLKIKHKIKSGETFDEILEKYSIESKEIIKIKKSLKKKNKFKQIKY